MTTTELAPIRQRRSYPKTLKAQIVAECSQAGASIASVALAHGVNANVVHKWIRQAQPSQNETPAFVPVLAPALAARHIEIRLSRGQAQATVHWPVSEAGSCVAWLREWLR